MSGGAGARARGQQQRSAVGRRVAGGCCGRLPPRLLGVDELPLSTCRQHPHGRTSQAPRSALPLFKVDAASAASKHQLPAQVAALVSAAQGPKPTHPPAFRDRVRLIAVTCALEPFGARLGSNSPFLPRSLTRALATTQCCRIRGTGLAPLPYYRHSPWGKQALLEVYKAQSRGDGAAISTSACAAAALLLPQHSQ